MSDELLKLFVPAQNPKPKTQNLKYVKHRFNRA